MDVTESEESPLPQTTTVYQASSEPTRERTWDLSVTQQLRRAWSLASASILPTPQYMNYSCHLIHYFRSRRPGAFKSVSNFSIPPLSMLQ